MAIHLMESRKTLRFPLEAWVAFSWKDDNGMEQRAKGRSRDISERGVFVLANNCPPVGVKIALRIYCRRLPALLRASDFMSKGAFCV